MRKVITCKTPDCNNQILLETAEDRYTFCPECKKNHSLKVLKVQVDHEKSIKDIILDSRLFKTANGMADYVGVSFVTMYSWIKKYFEVESFQDFKRIYICKSDKCYKLDVKRSSYSRNDYILKKIRSKSNNCACLNSMEPDIIMTNCPPNAVSSILRGYPIIEKISDKLFTLAPNPVKLFDEFPYFFKGEPRPVHIF